MVPMSLVGPGAMHSVGHHVMVTSDQKIRPLSGSFISVMDIMENQGTEVLKKLGDFL